MQCSRAVRSALKLQSLSAATSPVPQELLNDCIHASFLALQHFHARFEIVRVVASHYNGDGGADMRVMTKRASA